MDLLSKHKVWNIHLTSRAKIQYKKGNKWITLMTTQNWDKAEIDILSAKKIYSERQWRLK